MLSTDASRFRRAITTARARLIVEVAATTTPTRTFCPRFYARPCHKLTRNLFRNGSYYYSNPNGSTYYNSGQGSSTYTAPNGNVYQSSSNSK